MDKENIRVTTFPPHTTIFNRLDNQMTCKTKETAFRKLLKIIWSSNPVKNLGGRPKEMQGGPLLRGFKLQ
jgi:hypothetical protein